jgi:xanthine/CO dehydrogenase XdhC/CoxF family maturation factor
MRAFRRLIDVIEAEGSAALVTLTRVEESSPREAGARMVVRPSGGFRGTIGGGALEWAALDAAQAALKQGRGPAERIDRQPANFRRLDGAARGERSRRTVVAHFVTGLTIDSMSTAWKSSLCMRARRLADNAQDWI